MTLMLGLQRGKETTLGYLQSNEAFVIISLRTNGIFVGKSSFQCIHWRTMGKDSFINYEYIL